MNKIFPLEKFTVVFVTIVLASVFIFNADKFSRVGSLGGDWLINTINAVRGKK